MSVQFGRCGIDVALDEASSLSIGRRVGSSSAGRVAGEDDVTLSGWILTATQSDAFAARQQMLGHMDNQWEPQIPFLSGVDVDASGYLVPVSADVSSVLGVSYQGSGKYGFQYRVTGQRTAASSMPRLQARLSGALRPNAHSAVLADTTPWHGYASSALGYAFGARGDTAATRVGPGGTWNHLYSAQAYQDGFATWTSPPASYYDMAAYFSAGSPLRTVVGRQFDAATNRVLWEIGNGLFKIGPGSGTGLLTFTMPVAATPSVWGTPIVLDVGWWGGAWFRFGTPSITNVSVVYNAPELCIVRLTVTTLLAGVSSFYVVDIAVRRGDRGAVVTVKAPVNRKWGMGFNATTGCSQTLIHGNGTGIRVTADDGDHNRMHIFTSAANTVDLVNGRCYNFAGTGQQTFYVVGEVGGSTSAVQDTSTTLQSNFFVAQNESQRVVLP